MSGSNWDVEENHRYYIQAEALIAIYRVMVKLDDMGYYAKSIRDVVKIIEENNIDISGFDFPGESFEKFKQDVVDGKYDLDKTSEGRKLL